MADIQFSHTARPRGEATGPARLLAGPANGAQGDGATEDDAIANAKARLAAGEEADGTHQPN
jgi:hypothetical protein